MFKKHIQKGTGYSRLFIEKEITPLPRPVSCAEHAEHRPLPPPGAPRRALRGNPRVQHAAACGEAQTSGFGSRVCLQTQVRRGETEKTSPSLTRKRLVAAPVLNLFFFFFNSFCSFALLFYERCRGYVRGAQTAPQPKQWHLGGISPGQSSNWWGRAPPQCRCWGTHFPSLPLSGSSVPHAMRCTWVFCQAGGEGDPPSSPPEIVPILTLPQCWVPIGSPSPSSA